MIQDDQKICVRDIMTKKVISVHPQTPFLEAAGIIFEHDFDGLPVVDKENKLVGVLTEYDFIVKGSVIHLPTLIKLLKKIPLHKKDKELLGVNLKQIFSLKVKDVMNSDPLFVSSDTNIEDAARLFSEHHRVNPIPVANKSNTLVGILSRYDIIKMYSHSLGVKDGSKLKAKRYIDKRISNVLTRLEGKSIIVSKIRARFWFIVSLAFIIIGFLIAMALILRIRIEY